MKIIEIKNLRKKFKDNVAVDGINLSVEEGEIYGFLGPNGAGKSTTINILTGILSMDEGEIKIFQKDIIKNSDYVKRNIGIVPQDISIYEDLTAYENVNFFAGLYGLRGEILKNKVKEALEFVGLTEYQKSFAKNFSGGMKRRLNIACAIAHNPKIIIMDEPTVGIDPQSRNHILESVKKLNKKGCTIIYTSHYMEEVEQICTKVAIIDHGKIIAEGDKEELKSLITDKNMVNIKISSVEDIKLEELKEIEGICNIEIKDNVIRIESLKEINNLDKIIMYFVKNKIHISTIESKEPDLETVFLTLTGRKLRD
ncbi:ABC transporter ATP-binding protein [Haloimpatiens sp. FM7315]|uniref:ABC transporter ATP-binding protein n=1 Tax=Haloimpatiens sp. FM7315 TaxID=3298609 RepID=UPI0035A36CC4